MKLLHKLYGIGLQFSATFSLTLRDLVGIVHHVHDLSLKILLFLFTESNFLYLYVNNPDDLFVFMIVLSPLFTVLLLPPGVLSPLPNNKCRFIVWLPFCVVQNKVVDHNTAGAIVFTK